MSQAAQAAGFREARIVNEPTAAALAFGREGRFLILDFGAGTADVSVVESENGVWQVLESVGSARAGGYDFDLALAEWLSERLRLDPMPLDDPRRRALILEAETVKIALSSCRSYNWLPPALDGREFQPLRVEREDLERMMRFSIRRLMHAVRKLWERYGPEHLLLVGGSSRIPLLHEILEEEIVRPERLCLCAEESVAAGAALYARTGENRLLLDVLSGDIGFSRGGETRILAAAGSPLPLSARAVFVPKRSERTKLTVFQDIGDMQSAAPRGGRAADRHEGGGSEGGGQGGRTVLSVLELDVTAGTEVAVHCALSASGLLNLSAGQDGAVIEMPLFLPEGLKNEVPADRNGERLREIKLRIASLETLLSEGQKDRLYSVLRLLENSEGNPAAAEMLEQLTQDLELALE
jgi:molecular chaperone DnaK (HSP70)